MLKHTAIITALLFATACEFERQESVGEELREAGNAMDDGWDDMKDEAGDVGAALTEKRSKTEKRFDEATRGFEEWYQAREKELEEAGDSVSEETRQMMNGIEEDLDALREDIEELGQVTDAEWEATKKSIDEQIDSIGQAIDSTKK